MEYEFKIVIKEFKDEKGQVHPYPSYELTIGGKTFNLVARAEDKQLLKYILEQEGVL